MSAEQVVLCCIWLHTEVELDTCDAAVLSAAAATATPRVKMARSALLHAM